MTREWQAARKEILYLALAGMDTCCLLPILLAIGQFAVRYPPARATMACYIVILLAFNLTRFLDTLKLREGIQRDIGLLVLLLWVLTTLRLTVYRHYPLFSFGWVAEMAHHLGDQKLWPQDMTVVAVTLVFWWRGLELAGRSLEVGPVAYSFRVGVLIMAVAVGLVSQLLDWSPTPFVFGYFFLALTAIALARAEAVGRWRGGLQFPFSAGWLFSVAAAAGAVILAAVGLIALFTGRNILQALALLGPVWDILLGVLVVVLTMFFALTYPIIQFLFERLAKLLSERTVGVEPGSLPEAPFRFRPEEFSSARSFLEPYQPILVALVMLAGILFVALFFRRLWRARSQLGEVETESVWGERGPGLGLADRARHGLKALMGRLGFLNRWYTAASIRRVYAQMVAAATQRGYPRTSADTPYEYLPTLAEVWPGMQYQARVITEAYIKTHYGELPETDDELRAIQAALDQLRQQ